MITLLYWKITFKFIIGNERHQYSLWDSIICFILNGKISINLDFFFQKWRYEIFWKVVLINHVNIQTNKFWKYIKFCQQFFKQQNLLPYIFNIKKKNACSIYKFQRICQICVDWPNIICIRSLKRMLFEHSIQDYTKAHALQSWK